MASSLFEYDCEAVRVYARRLHPRTGVEEQRRFSVDPNLTTFDILRSILVHIKCRSISSALNFKVKAPHFQYR